MSQTNNKSPLHDLHTQQEAFFLTYGTGEDAYEVVETFGDLDMEYAAIRKGCVIYEEPHIGTIRVSGKDRGEFLNNMLTSKVDELQNGDIAYAFWLNRKGRIEADLRIAQREHEMLISLDRSLIKTSVDSISSFLFAEEVEIRDVSAELQHLSIHGPTSLQLIDSLTDDGVSVLELKEKHHMSVQIDEVSILIERIDFTGEIGLYLTIPRENMLAVYTKLLEVAQSKPELKAKPTGWLAINAARIEAGNPMFQVDFGQSNLPVESGIIDTRVNFTKGCYLGQEVVARMHARNACTKKVVAIRVVGEQITTENQEVHQPVGGSQIFEPNKEGETPIGSVTSSTISPMLGAIPICFAMLKNDFTTPGTKLKVSAEGKLADCVVEESLVFWKKASTN
ncbi:MAG: glycine cleavage T C-terminal barrel domain-containing protein [Phycisphaerales bacterium]|nr:glycine cleavage T C-terminal barrel domain-containing protein [Phycisphaerales bacterium]